MIKCHRKHLEERCLERGFALADAMPCVVSVEGDMWTIDVNHASYPASSVGALSFKCVPDCTTPDFVCLPGYCCTENIFDGSNSCLPCPSSSSSSSSSLIWGPYVCRKQTISAIDIYGNPIGGDYYVCITDCDSNPADCNSPDYPHHCNQSGDCCCWEGGGPIPEQCDGYNLDSTTKWVSECKNVNSCSECAPWL